MNAEDFRYGGPRPQTREMGILCVADSVEAAARSIEKPTPTRIEALVDEVTNKKLQDGRDISTSWYGLCQDEKV